MAVFTGAGVAIITPFHADGSINYDKLAELIDYHCEKKTDAIIICGTTGESATMSREETSSVYSFYSRAGKGKNPGHCRNGLELHKECRRGFCRSSEGRRGRSSCCDTLL